MTNNNPQKSFLPQCDGYALDFIKLCAACFMIIDHINTLWLHDTVPLMMFIGRGTFPLFCYAVAIAILKVNDGSLPVEEKKKAIKRYLIRLFILAVVAQPFYFFAVRDGTLNVIFTLALGVIFADLSFRIKLWQMYTLYIVSIFSMLWILPLGFGLTGVMLPSAIVLVLRGQRSVWLFLILLLLFINAGGILVELQKGPPLSAWAYPLINGLSSIALPWFVLDAARNMRQSGRFLPKYALHVFYPAHLAILKLLGLAFFK